MILFDGQIIELHNIPQGAHEVRVPLVSRDIDVALAIQADSNVTMSKTPPADWRWSDAAWIQKRDNLVREAYFRLLP